MKYLVVFAGPNGSGKSTIIFGFKNNETLIPIFGNCPNIRDILYINADYCAKADKKISQMPEGEEKDRAAWERTNQLRDTALKNNCTFVWETVASHQSRLEILNHAHELGYCVILVYVCTKSDEINIERVKKRVEQDGHGVPEDKIRSRYAKSVQLLPDLISSSDFAFVCDNSSEAPKLIFQKINNLYFSIISNDLDQDVVNWLHEHVEKPLRCKKTIVGTLNRSLSIVHNTVIKF
ncbi:MAG TPA: AAA family ATPase [Methanocorpusculum sp.]|nr:AAA family ATPase [Methanocorpusculum sp.]